jgi:hypothetical protein
LPILSSHKSVDLRDEHPPLIGDGDEFDRDVGLCQLIAVSIALLKFDEPDIGRWPNLATARKPVVQSSDRFKGPALCPGVDVNGAIQTDRPIIHFS